MLVTLKPQIVLTMIGPSHSGKTTQSRAIEAYLKSIGRTVKVISSDAIRRELLNLEPQAEIPTAAGFAVSEITFKKLFNELNTYMSSPVNTDVIIIDTTGLDRKFREQIAEKAAAQGYGNMAMLFLPNKEQLISRIQGQSESVVEEKWNYISRQLTRLKERVLPQFNKHSYIQTYRITDKINTIEYNFESNAKVLTITEGSPAIYGDIHQCYEEFQNLLLNLKAQGVVTQHLSIGDWIDKGDESSLKVIINVLYNYVIEKKIPDLRLDLLKGNHEEYVYRHLKDPEYVFTETKETEYFTSLRYLTDPANAVYKQKFMELYEASYDYAELRSDRFWGIVSHSPCEGKYLGKQSPKALKLMRNTRFVSDDSDYSTPAVTKLGPILEETSGTNLTHIFGHVEVGIDFFKYRNKVAIDQGCVSGGHLTAMVINLSSGWKTFFHEKSTKVSTEKLLDFSYHIKPWTKVAELNAEQEKKLRRIKRANPAFISGTVSPAPSFIKDGTPFLETVTAAVNLFERREVTQVIAQKKHMGSRCQIYLTKDLETCYATSRNGFKIHTSVVGKIIEKLFEEYKDDYESLLILDGELLPWGAIGRGLIDHSFYTYYTAVNTEVNAIAKSSISTVIPDLEISQSLENIQAFKAQVDNYATVCDAYYEPFGVIYCDGQELLTSSLSQTLTRFRIAYESFDLTNENDVIRLNEFYNEQVKDGKTEGIVIKPNTWKVGDIPMIKVRNEEYLRLVYGYNYTKFLERHTREKDIRGKLNLSIREQELNLYLLNAFKQGDLAEQEEIYKLLLVEFSREEGIDPRL